MYNLRVCTVILVDPLPGVETKDLLVAWLTCLLVDCLPGDLVT